MKDYAFLVNNKNFIYLWGSQVLSQLTIQIMNFLLLIRIFQETGSPIAISFLWVAYSLPALFFGPIGSAIADLVDKRTILMVTNLLQSSVIFLYAVIANHSVFLLYALVLAYSLLNQFYVPAELAVLPSVVKEKYFARANSLFFITNQAALIIGVALAGPLSIYAGFENTLLVCALLLLIAFISVTILPKFLPKTKLKGSFSVSIEKFFERIVSGYNFIKKEKFVLAPLFLLIFIQVILTLVAINLPILADNLFSINIESAGAYLVIPASLGALSASYLIPKYLKSGVRKKAIIEKGLFLISLSLLFMTFLVPELKGPIKIITSFIFIYLLGFSFMGVVVPSQTLLQEKTPANLRGRVFGSYWYLVTIITIFPILLSGAITELMGVRFFLFALTGIFIVVLIAVKGKDGQLLLFNKA